MSAWYRTGKVNVSTGSQTVVGVGAIFAANVRVGDGFRGPDGAWYEIINVPTDTSISIFPAYVGATMNNGTYMVAPLEGYVKESADRLRQMVEQFGDALIDLTGKTVVVSVAGVAADDTNNVPVAGLKTALGVDNLQPKETGKGLSSNDYTTLEKNKLGAIASGATANSSDAALLSRANHTGSQLASTISDFATAVRATVLTGLVFTSSAAVVATDSVLVSLGKLQAQITSAANSFAANVRSTVLTGLSLATSTAVDATDTVLSAIGKLQAKINTFGTAATLTAAISTTDVTTGRALRIGDHGLGATISPFIPDMNAPTANGYSWVTSGTANPITGFASGTQVLTFFASATEVAQMYFSRTVPMRVGVRRMTTGTWQAEAELITSATAVTDPSVNPAGIVSSAVVSGFRVEKFANGTMCVTGKVSLASQGANTYGYQTLNLPVTFLNTANMIPGLTCNAQSTGDSYGVVFQRAASTSSILYAVRNGATAQAFEVNVQVWGTWK